MMCHMSESPVRPPKAMAPMFQDCFMASAKRFRGKLASDCFHQEIPIALCTANSYSYPSSPRRASMMRSNCLGAAEHCGTAKRTDEARNAPGQKQRTMH